MRMQDRTSGFIARAGLAGVSLALLAGTAAGAEPAPTGPSASPQSQAESARELAVPVRVLMTTRPVRMRVLNPDAAYSKAERLDPVNARERDLLLRNQVVVQTDRPDLLRAAIARLSADIPGLRVDVSLDGSGAYWAVTAPSVAGAIQAAQQFRGMDFVRHAAVDSGPWMETSMASRRAVLAHQERVRALVAPGVAPVGLPQARGGSDPLFADQWHLDNTVTPGRDLNVLGVYADGITGAGVTVGVAAFGESAIQPDHIDYGARFNEDLSQPPNPNAGFDDGATFYAGLIGATQGNSIGGQGIAPGVELASMIMGTDIRESQTYAWQPNRIDIKVHPRPLGTYFSPDDGYAPGLPAGYVMTSLENSLRLGRGRRGTVHVFSTGADGTFPSPYTGTGDGWQDIFDAVGEVAVSVTNNYTTIPIYPGGLVHNYPPAGHRDTFVIAPVGEDNNPDPFSCLGTGVFASVYADSLNFAFDPAIRGLTSTFSGDAFGTNVYDVTNASSAAVAAGIFALMLDANPNLSVRDIQHIIADTAVTTGLNYDFSNPYVNSSPAVMAAGLSGTSNWGSNGSFKIHSDQFGFGLIDADAAVEAARNYTPPGRLYVLDSGIREADIAIPTAEHIENSDTSSIYQVQTNPVQIPFCIRDNFSIESVEIELTIAGEGGNNDLIIQLVSPYGTTSNLHYPFSVNPTGTTDSTPGVIDSEDDTSAFVNVTVGGTAYNFYQHKFVSYKHWDELSGGRWAINIWDVGPDEELTEGEEPDGMDPGEDHTTNFTFPLAVPPNPARDEKTIESYRIRIYSTQTSEDLFLGCLPGETSCPGDLNGDGIVTFHDLQIFLAWYTSGNQLADTNADGELTYDDLLAFLGLWQPGYCAPTGFVGNRPNPGQSAGGPIVRPI